MYQYTYDQILADSPASARDQERAVLERAITLLRNAADNEASPQEEKEALSFTAKVWSFFIKDLAHPGNDLPPELRARLMSIGLWVMGEVCRTERGEARSFEAIADVCSLIQAGLH